MFAFLLLVSKQLLSFSTHIIVMLSNVELIDTIAVVLILYVRSLIPSFYSTLVSAVPSAVQTVTLVSEEPLRQAPHTPETVAPTDLNKTATELSDWLSLITQMLKSNIVTVGDVEEIRTTMGRLQVSVTDVVNRIFFSLFFCFVSIVS